MRPMQQFNSPFKICLFYSLCPYPALPCPAPRKGYSCEQNKQFRMEKMYLHVCIWRRLYRIVGLSLCEMLKTHVESFPSVNCFLFCCTPTHPHTHTCTHSHSARYASRPFLLPTFVRSENCKAFRAYGSCVCVLVCVCARV